MAISFKPADFSRVVEVGSIKSVKNLNTGANIDKFHPDYKLHYKSQKRTLTQSYMLVGTQYEDTSVIITRHDERNVTAQQVRINGTVYDITDCSPDDSNEVIRYDYLTIAKVDGRLSNG